MHNENQAVCQYADENGVPGLVTTGYGQDIVGAKHRLVGTEGVIEVRVIDGPNLRIRRAGDESREAPDCPDPEFGGAIGRAIGDLVESLDDGRTPALSADRALRATEVIFACYESARRRGRVDLPLEIDDNPLEAMVDAGELNPSPGE